MTAYRLTPLSKIGLTIQSIRILCFSLSLAALLPGLLFSQDQPVPDDAGSVKEEKNPYYPVEGMDNWSHELDVSDLEPGVYNFIVQGTDKAGNISFSDPIDVYVDPESDKPVVGISNPVSGMVATGMLNIIGTAVDDDGISSVEVKINDGLFYSAEGQEFWSYYLDTSVLDDGPCLLTVRAVDINGVQGDEKTVSFILDRSIPANEITSHGNGDLVHGKIKVEGKTRDGNGISQVEVSLDGESYNEVSWKRNKKESSGTFSFALDTRDLEDGPRIIWIRSTDETGSVGLSSFLLFVDNNPPALEILYPGEEDSIDGRFTVVGTAQDDIGLASLSYRVGGDDPVNVPLIPGDPYWSVPFDLNNEKKADIRFSLVDLTGNEVEIRLKHDFDLDTDKPVIDLLYPLAGTAYRAPVFAGFVSDDDGDVDVVFSVDGGEEQHLGASYSFNQPLADLTPGTHRLEYLGVDRYGREGERVRISFTVTGKAPDLDMDFYEPLEEGDNLSFEQALELEPDQWKNLSGHTAFYNGDGSVSYSLDDSEEKKLSLKSNSSGGKSFKIPLKDLTPGYHTLLLNTVDRAGISRQKTFYFIISGNSGNRLHYADDRLASSGAAKDSLLVMEESDSVTFYWEGSDDPASAELSQNPAFLKTAVRDNRLILESEGPGYVSGLTITVVSRGGKETVLGPYDIVADSTDPVVNLSMAEDIIKGPGEMVVSGLVSENQALEALSVSINGGEETAIETEEGRFEKLLNIDDEPDGSVVLLFTARDRSGRQREEFYLFRKATAPPELSQVTPLTGWSANGAVTFLGQPDQAVLLDSVEYSADGVHFESLAPENFLKINLDLTPVETDSAAETEQTVPPRTIRLTDKAGNTALFQPDVLIDTAGDKPVVVIQIPGEDSLIQDDFTVSGMAFDDDEVASLLYRIDGGVEKELSGVNSFELPISVSDLDDNEHLLEIKALDRNGIEGDWSSLSFRVSLSEPSSGMDAPSMGESVRGVVEIRGYSEDPNGIEAVYISFDNGSSFDLMHIEALDQTVPEAENPEAQENTELENTGPENTRVSWSYSYNTNLLKDGNHSILFKGMDRYGISGLYTSILSIDNTSPSLEIRKPAEGLQFTGTVDLEGFIEDKGELARVLVEIQPLDEMEQAQEVELPLDSLVRGTLDLSGFSPGWINLRISAEDVTGNQVHISRNIRKIDVLKERRVTIISPSPGSSINSDVLVQGMVENFSSIASAELYLDGSRLWDIDIKDSGFFSAHIKGQSLTEGHHEISASVQTESGESVSSSVSGFQFSKTGPWITMEGYSAGDYAADRPRLTGRAGYDYIVPPLDDRELKAFEKSKAVDFVEISLDNGKTFSTVKGQENWEYRLETREIPNGELWLILRAHFKDGNSAVSRTVLVVDKTAPEIELLTPFEGARFNDNARFAGTAGDNNGLKSVEASLREGSKNHYKVPEFVQGLYLDAHFFGSTYAEGGVGLTFFDDNVKLEALAGYAPDGRFNGMVFGAKLLANVATLPWDFMFGYDFENFSSSLAVGTTFQYFTMQNSRADDANGMVLGAVLAQLELVNFKKPEWKNFSSFSFYVESQFWVISSDVEARIAPRVAFGLRTNIF